MSNLYKKILEKPKEVRRRIAFGITIFIGIIIFSFWLFATSRTIKETFSGMLDYKNENTKANETNKAPSIKEEINKMMNLVEETGNIEQKNTGENIYENNNFESEENEIDTTPDYQVNSEDKNWNNFEEEIGNEENEKESGEPENLFENSESSNSTPTNPKELENYNLELEENANIIQ